MPSIAAVIQSVYPNRVAVSVTGLTIGNDVVIYRSVGGERTLLRGGTHSAITDVSVVNVDAELPFGVPVTYIARVNDATEYSTSATSYTLTGGKVAVTDAITGLAAEVIVLAWDEKGYNRVSSIFKVGGRNVVVSGDLGMFQGSVELFTETTSSGDNLRAVLEGATSGVVQVRQPGGYDGVDSYLAVLAATERRFSQDGSDERRVWALEVAEVEAWASTLTTREFTLQDIGDAYTGQTLNDLSGDYATLLAVAQGTY